MPKFDSAKHAEVPSKKHILLFSWATQLLKLFLYLETLGKEKLVVPAPGR